jgi:ATP-dependent protease HslVU (ClpYQ) peptidase subunit
VTTIAALRSGQSIYMACDTMAADNSGRIWDVATKLRIVGDGAGHTVVLGTAGHRSVGPLIARHVDFTGLHAALPDDLDDDMQDIAEQIAEVLRAHHIPTCDDGLIDAAQLVVARGRLWMLTDGLAERIDADYTTIGSGADLALGALAATWPDDGAPEEHLAAAVGIAGRYDTSTGGPAHIVALHERGTYDRGLWPPEAGE